VRGRKTWDEYFLMIAAVVASRSKDPGTRAGAVLVRDRVIIATGYNGFPRGVHDLSSRLVDRGEKLAWTVHAEENALVNACRSGTSSTVGTELYVTPFGPCSRCSRLIVQAGIRRVIHADRVWNDPDDARAERAALMLSEGGVQCVALEAPSFEGLMVENDRSRLAS